MASPYRTAHAIEPVRAPWWWRWADLAPTWWLDVVGAAVVIACWPVAWWRHRRAWSAHKRRVLADCMTHFQIQEREAWVRWWCGGIDRPARLAIEDARTAQRQVVTGSSVGIQAGGDITIGLTKAPPRVATGEVEVPVRIVAPARKGGLLPRDEQITRPYEFTAEELRQRADRLDEVAIDLLRFALDLRRMADDIEGGGTKRLAEGREAPEEKGDG